MRWLATSCWLMIAWTTMSQACAAEQPTVVLPRNGEAAVPVVVGPAASPLVKDTAAELARYLGRISGGTFAVETGTGKGGLVIGRPGDFADLPFAITFGDGPLDREDYVVRSDPAGLYVLGATDLAVSHAAWDVLHRLGYRQFFPGPTWEVVPSTPILSIAGDDRQRPSFHARRIWYNWGLWGYNNEPYNDWCRRNRMAKGLDLNSGTRTSRSSPRTSRRSTGTRSTTPSSTASGNPGPTSSSASPTPASDD